MRRPWLAVLNPRSAHFKDRGAIDALRLALEEALGEDVTVKVSCCVGHVHRLARENREARGFIGLGGDGTLFDLINGMDLRRQRLAVVPVGTGNGLARDLGILSVEQAIAGLKDHRTRHIDLMKVELTLRGGERLSWFAASTVAAGYTAGVVETANAYCKAFGPLCYPLASLVRSFRPGRVRGRWRRDDELWAPLDATNLLVNNTRHAGNFAVFSEARLDDGILDHLVVRAGAAGQIAHNLSILTGLDIHRTGAPGRARRLAFEFDEEEMVMLDGEIRLGVVAMTVQCRENALALQA